jgi:hypothetical protein
LGIVGAGQIRGVADFVVADVGCGASPFLVGVSGRVIEKSISANGVSAMPNGSRPWPRSQDPDCGALFLWRSLSMAYSREAATKAPPPVASRP